MALVCPCDKQALFSRMALQNILPKPFFIPWTAFFRSSLIRSRSIRIFAGSITSFICQNFCFWRALNVMVYKKPIHSDTDLVARISVGAANIYETPGIFKQVRQPMLRRCEASVSSDENNLEHLWKVKCRRVLNHCEIKSFSA